MTAKQIKRLREKLKMSREELAAKIGTSVSSISRWESGTSIPMRFFMRQLEIVLKGEK